MISLQTTTHVPAMVQVKQWAREVSAVAQNPVVLRIAHSKENINTVYKINLITVIHDCESVLYSCAYNNYIH